MQNQYTGPYQITGISSNGQVDVENCENHSSDEIHAALSDSDSILDDNGTVSDSQIYQMRLVVQPQTLRVSQMILVLYLTLRIYEMI